MTTDLYNLKNERVGTVELPERIFKIKWNPDLVHQALRTQLSNRRTKSADTKDRAEVRGGGKKPWKQKGTGRARHGSIRSPIWKGGGVTHGPIKERDYGLKINKKMRQLAIFSALSKRLKDGEIKVIESLDMQEPKTKSASKLLSGFFGKKSRLNALLVPKESNKNIYNAVRNIEGIHSLSPKSLNIYDLLKYKIILIDKDAVEVINKHYRETN